MPRAIKHGGGDDEEGNLLQAGAEAGAQGGVDLRLGSHGAGHGGQFGGRDRHAKQRDRQHVERLGVGEQDVAAGKKAGELEIDESGNLQDSAADKNGPEGGNDGGYLKRAQIHVTDEGAQTGVHGRGLHGELQHGSDDRGPRDGIGDGDVAAVAESSLPDERGDHGKVHHDGRGIRKEEAAVAVEHAQTPGRKDEDSGAGKDDAHQGNGEGSLLALESRDEHADQQGRAEDSENDDDAGNECEQGEDRFGEFARLAVASLGAEAGVDGNKGCGEDTFAEQFCSMLGTRKAAR